MRNFHCFASKKGTSRKIATNFFPLFIKQIVSSNSKFWTQKIGRELLEPRRIICSLQKIEIWNTKPKSYCCHWSCWSPKSFFEIKTVWKMKSLKIKIFICIFLDHSIFSLNSIRTLDLGRFPFIHNSQIISCHFFFNKSESHVIKKKFLLHKPWKNFSSSNSKRKKEPWKEKEVSNRKTHKSEKKQTYFD